MTINTPKGILRISRVMSQDKMRNVPVVTDGKASDDTIRRIGAAKMGCVITDYTIHDCSLESVSVADLSLLELFTILDFYNNAYNIKE